jgi:hypothetical protein
VHTLGFLLIIAMGVIAPFTMALAVRGDPSSDRSRSFLGLVHSSSFS